MQLSVTQRWAALWLGLCLLLLVAGRTALLRDPGSFWHVAVGQRILTTGTLVKTDPFSITRQGCPWVDGQWLAEIVMAGAVWWGGLGALVVMTAGVLAALYTFLAQRLLRSGLTVVAVGMVTMLGVLASSHHFHARPLVVTLAGMTAVGHLLLEIDAGRRGVRALWWLVPLNMAWANSHGGVLGGLGSLWLVAGGWCCWRWLGRPGPLRSGRDVVELGAAVAAASAAVLVNPWGLELVRTWLAVLALPLGEIIQEHARLEWRQPYAWAAGGLVILYLAGLAGVPFSRWRVTWLLPLPWLVLSLDRVRNVPLMAVVTILVIAELLACGAWNARLRRGEWIVARPAGPAGSARRWNWGWSMGAVLVVLVGGWVLPGARPRSDLGALDPARWPVALRPALAALEAGGGPEPRVFNDMLFGGFLIYFHPGLPVFIDDRCELYGREFLVEYDRVRRTAPQEWERWDGEYRFCGALVERETPLDRYFAARRDWRLLGTTVNAALYGRQAGSPRGISADGEVPLSDAGGSNRRKSGDGRGENPARSLQVMENPEFRESSAFDKRDS